MPIDSWKRRWSRRGIEEDDVVRRGVACVYIHYLACYWQGILVGDWGDGSTDDDDGKEDDDVIAEDPVVFGDLGFVFVVVLLVDVILGDDWWWRGPSTEAHIGFW